MLGLNQTDSDLNVIISQKLPNYEIIEEIGHGTYGKVFLSRFKVNGDHRAIKYIQYSSNPALQQQIHKEIIIHKALKHVNIIQVFEVADLPPVCTLLVMELASGGELFDRIEPDVGLEEQLTHFYFFQLIRAVEYLHGQGVCHRDLKPENILLDVDGNLKLTDFGFSTIFRHQNKRRMLETACGTPVYMAPEVMKRYYDGEQVDLWSAGIILYVLLVGNTPWEEPTERDKDFAKFIREGPCGLVEGSWQNLSNEVKDLLCNILRFDPKERFTLSKIKNHPWFQQSNPLLSPKGLCANPEQLAMKFVKHIKSSPIDYIMDLNDDESRQVFPALSQPDPLYKFSQDISMKEISFSQPYDITPGNRHSQPLLPPLSANTPGQKYNWFMRYFSCHRLTRFYSKSHETVILKKLKDILQSLLVQFKVNGSKITFSTVDKHKCPLNGEISILKASNDVRIVVYKRNKGDPLEFKRFYKMFIEHVRDLIIENNCN
ncbi:Pkinase-domain-containing protein [Rozella allomycis CSF55]|uniref:non-specific serine/threonine protein kinase n=1 Tax=Rozella allomycis (strain CSF55) TaxID=988480 RepID=A0A075B385_ROZAC|nr:Protein kinase, catalytic domain-containing protein [Rozella allomycis CSF55]RKP19333.1 Pkinase-domain-containing protein [Rozella allomycis CSF55]|eukprot:EPZ36814.1 Protein kinase, catalytic domain-containing protein [Rozella allomycis CSF55]